MRPEGIVVAKELLVFPLPIVPCKYAGGRSEIRVSPLGWWVIHTPPIRPPRFIGWCAVDLPKYAYTTMASWRTKNSRANRKKWRTEILQETGNHCVYCGEKFPLEGLTIEHLLPVSQGGIDRYDNRVPACFACNTARGDAPDPLSRTVKKWRVYVKWKLGGCQKHAQLSRGSILPPPSLARPRIRVWRIEDDEKETTAKAAPTPTPVRKRGAHQPVVKGADPNRWNSKGNDARTPKKKKRKLHFRHAERLERRGRKK